MSVATYITYYSLFNLSLEIYLNKNNYSLNSHLGISYQKLSRFNRFINYKSQTLFF